MQETCREIPLVHDRGVMLVDAEDYEWLSEYRWYLCDGYAITGPRPDGSTRLAHRIIMKAPPGLQVDHRNWNGLDDRKANLRLATVAQNQHNQRPMVGGSSPFKGVSWHKPLGKWRACIKVNGRKQHLGYFTDEVDAARAYDVAAGDLRGDFAALNFPDLARTA